MKTRVASSNAAKLFGMLLVLAAQGCTPNIPLDSDNDGFSDNEEINGIPGTDPFDPTDNPNNVRDTDGDGCSNYDELNFVNFCDNDPNTPGGNGGFVDSDSDGFSDDEEINGIPGTDPFDPTDNPNNVRDTDGDGCSDFDELNFAGFCNNDPNVPDGDGTTTPGETVAVTGQVTVSASAVVDGDTNDPLNTVVANNAEDLTKVQAIPNPTSLGGFLGTIGTTPDVTDVYRVQMAAGQTATLFLADPNANDFDLVLYEETGDPLDSSEGIGKAEQVTATTNGTFLIEVYGFSVLNDADPGGLYTLLIGQSTLGISMAPTEKLSSLHPHVEDEVLVKYKTAAARVAQSGTLGTFELVTLNSPETAGGFERVRIALRDGAKLDGGVLRSKQAPRTALNRPFSAAIAAVKELRRRTDVDVAEPNYIRHTMAVPNDTYYNLQWHYPQISLPQAWDITTGDPSVIVAVIDTGVVLAHPDMQGQLVPGYDMISDPAISRDGDGIDADPDDPGDLAIQGTSSTFHGTHVAGTVAARTNNNSGVAGVAWDVKIMPIRVLGQGGGTDYDIVQGIRFAAGLSNDSGTVPAQRADIINMSLGGQGLSAAEQNAIDAARAAGVIVIAAAGNESSNADFSSPAGLDGVVTVSAVGFTRDAAPYSNFGSSVEVAAPGGDTSADANGDSYPDGVLSSIGNDNGTFEYDFFQGTSMACPHIAGVAALMKSVNANLTPDDFDQLLAGTHAGTNISITDDLGQPGKDTTFGYGLINALNAVRAAAEIAGVNVVDTPLLTVVPRSVDFGSDQTAAQLTVTNAGVDTLSVTSVTSTDTWLSANPSSGGEGTYTITVDRTGLADGIYTGSVTIASNGGSTTVSVRMSVGTPEATGGDVGTVYVLIIDLDTLDPVGQYNATAANGYSFSITDVPVGTYGMFAGTDLDNDSFIDNEGEALGSYPTLLDPQELVVDQDRSGISFNVSYQINIQTLGATFASDRTGAAPPRLQRATKRKMKN